MKTTHVMLGTFAVATALMASTGWAQESPPILVWDETGALVSEGGGYQSMAPAYAAQEEPSMAGEERTFAMSPMTTGDIGDELWSFDDRPFGNYSANIHLDDLRGL
jgi:hypothetical protein